MTPYFDNGEIVLYHADARRLPLEDGSVHCIVTSPPYYNQRVYEDIEPLIWGGEPNCEHQWEAATFLRRSSEAGKGDKQLSNPGANQRDLPIDYAVCLDCRAWRGSLGNEPNLSLYIDHLLEVFEECWRVLRDDGVMWVNMGSGYGHGTQSNRQSSSHPKQQSNTGANISQRNGAKAGDLLAAPFLLALALQVEGWIFRSDVIWNKATVMPQPFKGWRWENGKLRKGSWRSTTNHEYIFQFAKRMGHYGDAEAVALPSTATGPRPRAKPYAGGVVGIGHRNGVDSQTLGPIPENGLVNRRSVWRDIKHQNYGGAHYATFPPDLPRICIQASTSPQVCVDCGAPWARVVGGEGEFRATCGCEAAFGPAVVLDPFCGTGTTSIAARALGRRSIGVDLSRDYLRQASIRIAGGKIAQDI